MTSHHTEPRRGAGLSVALLLVLALSLTALLAFEAWRSARYHQAQAEGVLRDYARFAAESYAVRAAQALYAASAPALDGVQHAPSELPPLLRSALGSFALESNGAIRITGADDRVRAWLADTVRRELARYGSGWYFAVAVVRVADAPYAIVYRAVMRGGRVETASGFVAPAAALEPPLAAASRVAPLLPRALTGEVPADSLGSVRVVFGETELFRTRQLGYSLFTARAPMGDYFGSMAVEVALDPAAAGRLVIGGLPRSRQPVILGLLLLSVALVGTALVQLRRERQLAQLRVDFVSSVSHELRTPLAQVRMFAETLRLGRVRSDGERQRALEILEQEARRLTHLVENLLYFARSERLTLPLAPQSTHLRLLAQDVVDGFRPIASSRNATLRVDGDDHVTARVDEAAFRQMLLNLLDNALKYGPEGQLVRVNVEGLNGNARISVEDEGPGIPTANRDDVWQRFWRLERDRGSAVAGTGIGLSVVRDLITLHGGRAWVDESATGARIVLEFPPASRVP